MLDRAGIAKLVQERLDSFVANPPAQAYLYSLKITSGTTSEPLLSMLENVPQYFTSLRGSRMFMVCYAPHALRLSNTLYVRHQKTDGALRILSLDQADLVSGLRELLADLDVDVIRGTPSFLVRVAELTPTSVASQVKTLYLAGELFTTAKAAFLQERFPMARFKCSYISSELGLISEVTCGQLPFNQYHPRKGVTVEIDAPEGSDVGTLLITTTLEGGVRVERYRIGDSARWRSEVCLCGASSTFEVLGREGYDYVKLLGCTIRAEEGERIFADYKHLFDSYRIELEEVYNDGRVRGKVTLRVHSPKVLVSDAEIDAFIQYFNNNFFMTPTKTLAVLVHEGVFEPLVFLQESEPLPQGPKDYPLRFKK